MRKSYLGPNIIKSGVLLLLFYFTCLLYIQDFFPDYEDKQFAGKNFPGLENFVHAGTAQLLIPEVRLDSSVLQPARLLFGIVKYPVSLGVLVGLHKMHLEERKRGIFRLNLLSWLCEVS